jgi:putative DNA primase/helicase
LDAKEEHPETRVFKREPRDMVLANRAAYVAAVLTVARAWRRARDRGEDVACPPLAGFGQWSQGVRKALIWLGRADPVKSQEVIRAFDPERSQLRDLHANWPHDDPKASEGFTAAEFISVVAGAGLSAGPNAERSIQFQELRALLISVASSNGRDISPLKLANWLTDNEGKVIEGRRLAIKRTAGRSNRYVLEAV